MKSVPFVLAALASATFANTAPTVVIQSAAMRPGTTLMDVVYRVNDPDDATVKTRALAFVDGVRSFAKVLKPVTFVEGTAAKLGDAIPSNTNHTLTWDVAADWNVDLGQVKFEVLAMDQRGLLPFEWITIPPTSGTSQTTISRNSPTNTEVLNALFWQYANGDSWLSLANGILTGNSNSGVFHKIVLVDGNTIQPYSTPFVFKRINLDPDDGILATAARTGLSSPQGWHAVNRPYAGVQIITCWGGITLPAGLSGISAIYADCALKSDGTVVAWNSSGNYQTNIPAGLNGVTSIAGLSSHKLALKSDGTVVGWGSNSSGQITIPAGLSGVTAIATGNSHSLALKIDRTVVGWGSNSEGQTTLPAGLSGVTAIAAGTAHSLALKSDGTVVGWGSNGNGQTAIPAGLSGVTAIAAGYASGLALKSNGTVVGWGAYATPPAGLTNVTAIAAGGYHNLALRSDGTVIGWGSDYNGVATTPTGLSNVIAIAAGGSSSYALKAKAP